MAHKKILISKSKFNRVIFFLTMSDIFTWGLYVVINSLVGIYLSHKFGANAIEIVGIGIAVYNVAKGGFQIPIGIIADKIKNDKDDIILLTVGNLLLGLPYIFYPHLTSTTMFYALQFVIGIGAAMNLVNWRKLFAQNLEMGNEGLTYGLYDTIMSLAMILFGVLAGTIANMGEKYFDFVMTVVGILMISSGFWVVGIFYVKNRKSNN